MNEVRWERMFPDQLEEAFEKCPLVYFTYRLCEPHGPQNKNICYHVHAADALGFHATNLLTGHYGPNWNDLKRLVEIIQPDVAARIFSLPDFEVNNPEFDGDGESGGDEIPKDSVWYATELIRTMPTDLVKMPNEIGV